MPQVQVLSPRPFKTKYAVEFPSGQRGQTVNLLSVTSMVRIHPPPPKLRRVQCTPQLFSFSNAKRSRLRWYLNRLSLSVKKAVPLRSSLFYCLMHVRKCKYGLKGSFSSRIYTFPMHFTKKYLVHIQRYKMAATRHSSPPCVYDGYAHLAG